MTQNSATLHVEQHSGWALLRIDREAKRNALDRATRDSLLRVLEALRGKVQVIVLTGTGGSFCAGLDLKEREAEIAAGQLDSAGSEAIEINMALREHPAIVIAAVNGVALINSSDLALAADSATLGCPEISFASFASMAGPTSQLLVNRKRAAWLLLANTPLNALMAERWGLLNEVVPDDQLMTRTAELARTLAGFDPAALEQTKKALQSVPEGLNPWRSAMEQGQKVNMAIRKRRELPVGIKPL
jgi:enoyl-CoA hydratase/carnithine racemase